MLLSLSLSLRENETYSESQFKSSQRPRRSCFIKVEPEEVDGPTELDVDLREAEEDVRNHQTTPDELHIRGLADKVGRLES